MAIFVMFRQYCFCQYRVNLFDLHTMALLYLRVGLLLALLLHLCPLTSADWPGLAQRQHHEPPRPHQELKKHVPRKPKAVCSIVRYCPDPILTTLEVTTLGVWRQHQRPTTKTSSTSSTSLFSSLCTTLETSTCKYYTVCNLTASAPTDTCTDTSSMSTPCSIDTSSTTYWVSWSSPLPSPASYSYGQLTPWPRKSSSSSSWTSSTSCSLSSTSTPCSSTADEITSWPPSFATESTTRHRHHSHSWRSIHSFHSIVTPSVPEYPTTTTSSTSTSEDECEKTTTTHTTKNQYTTSFILP